MVQTHDRFIVELNWFIQLYEFGLVVNFIRKHNATAQILFGGLYASILPEEIFRRFPVDFTIRGDNEWPIQQYLDGVPPRDITNFMGRGFTNPIGYVFSEKDYLSLNLNLDWFPSYFRYRDPRNLFLAPHIVTAKGGCNAAHAECAHCMGAQLDELRRIYGRPPIVMSETSLFHLLSNADNGFKEASLFITKADHYDFTNKRFDLDVTIEIDAPVTMPQAKAILRAFRKVFLLIPIYGEGIMGSEIEPTRYQDLIGLEDKDHLVRFYVLQKDARDSKVPRDHVVYSEFACPESAGWNYYTRIDAATELSQRFYETLARRFVDGTPTSEATNPNFHLQTMRFSADFR